MSWFSYRKENSIVDSYPYVKRSISRFTPADTLEVGTWLFVDVKGLDIDKYYNQSSVLIEDQSSYLVVYEDYIDGTTNTFVPVECVINNDILYFKTAEEHSSGTQIGKQYSIYYRTPNIRYIDSNLGFFEVGQALGAPFAVNFTSIDLTTFEVFLDSIYSYSFSFVNQAYDWDDGLAKRIGAKAYLTFSGPDFELYGSKGPDYGKIKLKIVSYGDEAAPVSKLVLDTVVDLYYQTYSNNELLFSSSSLLYGKYSMELEVLASSNILSTGNQVKLNSYQFSYYVPLTLGKEELTDNSIFISLGGL